MKGTVRVGVGLILFRDGKILLGKRKNSHGEGSWAFIGGHLELNESLEQCARREAMEEAGIKIKNILFVTATNDIFKKDGKHYVTLFLRAEYQSGELRNCEPEKLEKWGWFPPDKLPKPLFIPIQNLLKEKELTF